MLNETLTDRASAPLRDRFAPIKTKRLSLRCLLPSDASWMAQGIANPNVAQWLTSPPHPFQRPDAEAFLARVHGRADHRAILLEGQAIGVVSLTLDRAPPELGYWLAQSAWGQGYMTEAACGLLDWHFAADGAPVASNWILGNTASAHVLDKLGFWPTGQALRHSHYHGKEVPVQTVALAGDQRAVFTLSTPRLVLDAVRYSDIGVIQKDFGDPDVARMMETVIPNWTFEQARDWLTVRRKQSLEGVGLAVRLADGTMIGSVRIGGAPAKLGYMFAKAHWGKGYASEAIAAFLRGAFDHLTGIETIDADIYDDNPGSVRIVQKLGFVRHGQSDCRGLGRVESSPSSIYRVTRDTLKV